MSDKFISLDSLKEYNKQMKETYIEPLDKKIDEIVADLVGKTDYLGTVSSMTDLSTTAGAGDYYRVSTEFVYDESTGEKAHVGDILIAIKSNPTQDKVGWDLVHAELDNDTWTANTAAAAGYVEKGEGQVNKVWMTDENGNPSWRKVGEYGIKAIPDTNDYDLVSITFSDRYVYNPSVVSATLFGPSADSSALSDPTGAIPTTKYLSTDYFKVKGLHATDALAIGAFGLAADPKAVYTATTISIQSSDVTGGTPTTEILTIPKETGTLATREWIQSGFTVGDIESEYCAISNNLIYLGYIDDYSEDAYTKLSHNGLKHRGADATWELDGLGLKMVTPEGYMYLDSEERFIKVGADEENAYQLIFPLENGTLATQAWTNTHYYPDLVISTATEVNSDIQRNGNSITFYEPTMGSESRIYRTAADEYLHFADGDGVIFHGDIEVEKDIYEKSTALKDKYISCQEIPWSEFITKVINTNMQPPICMIDISNATHMDSYYKDYKKKKWIDLDTFKNGSLQIPKAELSDEWIEEGNYMVGTTNWGYLYVVFKGTYITYEILDNSGHATFEQYNSASEFDPVNSSDWEMPVISVGIR